MSLEAIADSLGIPMEIQIDDGLRQSGCDAHMGTLTSIEGTIALYKGQCANRHVYEQRFEIEELRQQLQILNGEVVIGAGKSHKLNNLEEF